MLVQSRGGLGYDAGIESSRVVGSACSCLAGEDSVGSGDVRVASAVRNKPPILVGMSEKVVNNSYARNIPCLHVGYSAISQSQAYRFGDGSEHYLSLFCTA